MILSAGFIGGSSGSGFVEFAAAGTNQSITSGMIPAGVTRVRVHLIGGGGGNQNGNSGGTSLFSAAGVSVVATGGFKGGTVTGRGGQGGAISAVTGVIGSASGGVGGTVTPAASRSGAQGGIGIDVGVAMGGGGGAWGQFQYCPCGSSSITGAGGQVGLLTSSDGSGGAGGGYNQGQTLPLYGSYGGEGSSGEANSVAYLAGGGGAYAMFYAPVQGATAYTNAINIGAKGGAYTSGKDGYCRIEWGSGI